MIIQNFDIFNIIKNRKLKIKKQKRIEYLEKRRLFLENIDNQLYELMKLL